jgi:hypothetical protein
MIVIVAGFESYDVSITKALSITYITGHNWMRLLSDYNLKPSDKLHFTLTSTPELVLVAFKRRKGKS